ncbi:NCS1 family nucleobase:cation symporter-1 [Psychrobacillus sp. INOP01]|uniref:NCS1 family nucleobase:cation symporter-1 n=1 Tax=Psychrobacillus sp. INOP01 TaxID=2829187 RepID=UPI001BA6FEFB|nr:NCS1 family nucleobase:cation symporter-1 [Psychrobacillus sp. INOP01]QUG40615.1 NCS1 family nucleobase:cation symporter-1 [Psychrobacillus sp. INOP01]
MQNKFQNQIDDIIELNEVGIEEIKKHKNNYTESTRPISKAERSWGAFSMGNLWIGMIVSIAVYQVASGLIVAGMTWYQALFTIVLGHTLVMGFALILGHFGTKYGLNFPMLCKMAFGTKGVIIPALIRGIIGCFWFGVQAWIGGQAVNAILKTFIPAWSNLEFFGLIIAFLLFWLLNVYIAWSGSKGVKMLQDYAAPLLILLSLVVIIWSLNTANWSFSVLLSEPILHGNGETSFAILFFPALSAMIAFDAGIALSMADFTRYSKSQKAQIKGQIISAPLITLFIAFVGICGTAGASIAFNEAIWEPAVLVGHFENPFVVVIFSTFIIMAVLTTNVAANLVPPINVIATIFARNISYKQATLIASVLALIGQPWKTLATPDALIFDVLGILGAILGPVSGLFIVSYLFVHKTKVDLVSIYREDGGKYFYKNGWNVEIISILLLSTIFIILGKYYSPLQIIFDNAYVLGSIGAGLIYYLVIKLKNKEFQIMPEGDLEQ